MEFEKELIGKSGKIIVLIDGKKFYYTAKEIRDVTDHIIYFYDKFGSLLGFRKDDILQITIKKE